MNANQSLTESVPPMQVRRVVVRWPRVPISPFVQQIVCGHLAVAGMVLAVIAISPEHVAAVPLCAGMASMVCGTLLFLDAGGGR